MAGSQPRRVRDIFKFAGGKAGFPRSVRRGSSEVTQVSSGRGVPRREASTFPKAGRWIGLLGFVRVALCMLGAVERPLRSFAAFEELGGVEFRVPAKFASEAKTRRRSGSAAI